MSDSFKINSLIWESIYKQGNAGAMLKYPCEDFVVALSRYFAGVNVKKKKLLYVGFGSGNNLMVAAEKGFECYGVEVSSSAIQIAQERLNKAGYSAQLFKITQDQYSFIDIFFDVVIAWHVLSYNDEKGVETTLTEIKRVLKPSGALLATFPTFREFRVAKGKRIVGNTFEFICAESNQKGVIVTAAETEEEVRKVFRHFANIEIGYSEITVKGITNSHWLIYGTKGE